MKLYPQLTSKILLMLKLSQAPTRFSTLLHSFNNQKPSIPQTSELYMERNLLPLIPKNHKKTMRKTSQKIMKLIIMLIILLICDHNSTLFTNSYMSFLLCIDVIICSLTSLTCAKSISEQIMVSSNSAQARTLPQGEVTLECAQLWKRSGASLLVAVAQETRQHWVSTARARFKRSKCISPVR